MPRLPSREGYYLRASRVRLSEPGIVTVADKGTTHFAALAAGKHRYLMLDLAQ